MSFSKAVSKQNPVFDLHFALVEDSTIATWRHDGTVFASPISSIPLHHPLPSYHHKPRATRSHLRHMSVGNMATEQSEMGHSGKQNDQQIKRPTCYASQTQNLPPTNKWPVANIHNLCETGSRILYCVPVWHPGLTAKHTTSLERVQKRALRTILGANYIGYQNALLKTGLNSLHERRIDLCRKFAKTLDPELLPPKHGEGRRMSTRNSDKLRTLKYKTNRYKDSPIPYLVRLLNT